MKVTTILFATVGLVAAQNFNGEPSCAVPCLTSAISKAGCALTDQACQCGTGQAAIQTAVTPCLLSACSPADLNSAASAGFALCSAFSLTGAANATATSVTTTATTSPASTTGTTNSRSGSGTGTGSKTGTGVVISTPSATNTSTVTARTTTASGSGSGTTTSPSGSKTSGTGTGTSSSASTVSSAGAGQMAAVGLGGLVGVLGAVVAAL